MNVGTRPVRSEKREPTSTMWQTLLVVLACTGVPLVAVLILIAVRRSVTARHADHFTQPQTNAKNFAAGHVIQTTGNGSQQVALGYVHHQVDFKRFEPIFALSINAPVGVVVVQTFRVVINVWPSNFPLCLAKAKHILSSYSICSRLLASL